MSHERTALDHHHPLISYTRRSGATFLVDKPLRWTSFDVVKKLRTTWGVKKIGHAGTLDPLATGLLIVCAGLHTKSIRQYQDMDKVYRGEMVLGKTTPSVDLETDFDSEVSCSHVAPKDLQELVPAFVGAIEQVPPAHSAVKRNGTRSYKRARRGLEVSLEPRCVTVHHFVLTTVDLPRVAFEVACSKGTYIRSLVRDFGQRLGVGAHLASLRRTQIGPFRLQDAYAMDMLAKMPPEPPIIT
ncbi:MAG: tRNA pseudouridine(55) synthase TruB [Bacteroidota bacterium]